MICKSGHEATGRNSVGKRGLTRSYPTLTPYYFADGCVSTLLSCQKKLYIENPYIKEHNDGFGRLVLDVGGHEVPEQEHGTRIDDGEDDVQQRD